MNSATGRGNSGPPSSRLFSRRCPCGSTSSGPRTPGHRLPSRATDSMAEQGQETWTMTRRVRYAKRPDRSQTMKTNSRTTSRRSHPSRRTRNRDPTLSRRPTLSRHSVSLQTTYSTSTAAPSAHVLECTRRRDRAGQSRSMCFRAIRPALVLQPGQCRSSSQGPGTAAPTTATGGSLWPPLQIWDSSFASPHQTEQSGPTRIR